MLARVGLAAALFASADAAWRTECADPYRSNSVIINASQVVKSKHAYAYQADLGTGNYSRSQWRVHSMPTVTPAGIVLVADVECRIMAFAPPETLPYSINTQKWNPLWVWEGALSNPNLPYPECTSVIVDANDRAVFYSRQKRKLFGLDVSKPYQVPQALFWSGIQPPAQYFQTYGDGVHVMLHTNAAWLPSHDAVGVFKLDLTSGQGVWMPGSNNTLKERCAGTVGVPQNAHLNSDNSAIAVMMDNTAQSVQYYNTSTGLVWTDAVNFASGTRDEHPTYIDFSPKGNWYCILLARLVDSTMHLGMVATGSGNTCWNWPKKGVQITNKFLKNGFWLSSPAVLYDPADNPDPIVYFVARLPNGKSSVVSYILTDSGAVERDGHTFDGYVRAAPIVVKNAWGTEKHAVYVPGYGGRMHAFDAMALGEGSYANFNPRRNQGYCNILGFYMAATQAGTSLYICHDGSTGVTHMIGIASLFKGQEPLPAPAAEPTGMSSGAVAGTVIGVLSLTGAGVFFAMKRGAFGAVSGGYDLVGKASSGVRGLWEKVTGNGYSSKGFSSMSSASSTSTASSTGFASKGGYGAV